MTVNLYTNISENNCIGKTLTLQGMKECVFKQGCSAQYPVLVLESDVEMTGINYMYISDFNRYYFINEIKALTGTRYEIRGSVDVLESFKLNILNLNCIINGTEKTGKDVYLSNEVWTTKVKDKTDIINFQHGLLESGEFILITAGG